MVASSSCLAGTCYLLSIKGSQQWLRAILGVQIQQDLKWTKHIDGLLSKLKTRLTGLNKVKYMYDNHEDHI